MDLGYFDDPFVRFFVSRPHKVQVAGAESLLQHSDGYHTAGEASYRFPMMYKSFDIPERCRISYKSHEDEDRRTVSGV